MTPPRSWTRSGAPQGIETVPRWVTPRNPARESRGREVVGVMRVLGQEPMPYQREIFDTAFEVDAFGQLWYREIVIILPRQSGKTTIVIPWGTHRALMWPERQHILYIAQTYAKALEKLTDEQHYRIKRSPIGRLLQPSRTGTTLRATNGMHHMLFKNGSKWSIDAATETAGHGSTLGLGMGDELFAQKDDRLEQAISPAMIAVADAQRLWISTAGYSQRKSPFLWEKKEQGRARVELLRADLALLNDPRYRSLYIEYSAPMDADPDDPLTYWGCMPALGFTQSLANVISERENLKDGFFRPYLNWWADELTVEWKIPKAKWEAVADPDSEPAEGQPVVYVIDVSPDSTWASIGVAGPREDGAIHGEVLADAPRILDYDDADPTGWLIHGDRDRDIPGILDVLKRDDGPVYVELKTAGFLVPKLQELGVDVRVMADTDIAVAGPGLLDAVLTRQFRHTGQEEITDALQEAAVQAFGDGWKFTRSKSMRPITALVSVAYARQMLSKLLPELSYDPLAAFREANRSD